MVKVMSSKKDWGGVAKVDFDNRDPVYFTGFDKKEAQIRADLFRSLYEKCGPCDIIESGSVPINVACSGKPAIAAYLYAVQLWPIETIAYQLSVSSSTVEQYLSDIRRGRR